MQITCGICSYRSKSVTGMLRRMDVAWVYMLASRRNGTLYTGATVALAQRVWQHRTGTVAGFTAKYGVTRLVWYAAFASLADAQAHETRLKRWRRAWKITLIEKTNPDWNDLYETLLP